MPHIDPDARSGSPSDLLLATDADQPAHAVTSTSDWPLRYSDLGITTVQVIKRVLRLTLRAAQDFIDSIFALMDIQLRCPDCTSVSKRVKSVNDIDSCIVQSMSRRGNYLDNAVIESVFGTLKSECYYPNEYKNEDDLKRDIIGYIDHHNKLIVK